MHQNTYYRATLVGLLCLCYKEQHLITVNDEQIFAFIISKFGDSGLCLLMGVDEYQACSHLLLTGLLGSRSRVHIEEHGQNVRLIKVHVFIFLRCLGSCDFMLVIFLLRIRTSGIIHLSSIKSETTASYREDIFFSIYCDSQHLIVSAH